ncbi:MAG: type ISP restriction/modification enzyme [Reyranellaceae bacterium]
MDLPIKDLAVAISAYGAAIKPKLSGIAIEGAPEDQLRAPLDALIQDLAQLSGMAAGAVRLVGEITLADLKTRPDFAVTAHSALIGFVEVKAPGKGANPNRFTDPHDKAQWNKLKSLPNLLYTDGNSFSLWRDGKIVGAVVHLDGDVTTSGDALAAPSGLLPLVSDFLRWEPLPPRNAKALAEISARLCRLLRDEVIEQMESGRSSLNALANDWRKLLFPQADDAQFADGYAQAVTFGLLVARARGIALDHGIEAAATELRATNSLVATALRLLTDDATNRTALRTSLGTLTRVLNAVDWPTISKDNPDAWLYFYEAFLEVYDNALRKRTGSYYTPPEVVTAMVGLVDEALRGPLFERATGLASADVFVADPAVGTGTFLLGVLRRIASIVSADQGPGAVRAAVEAAAAQRIFGFEMQFGPFAVAQLRLIAEMQILMGTPGKPSPTMPDLRLFITDTLGDPFIEEDWLPQVMEPVARSRREANAVKRGQPITVVIGNPPYKEKAEGRGGWIEAGSKGREAPMDRWKPPPAWGVGAHAKHLKNLYVYFWRWATWKVFGSGLKASTNLPERDEEGIVCFITVAGFLNGRGFQRMRDDLRRTCSDIWVIDCSPEGHQPEVATRIFQGVQQPVCIVLAARKLNKNPDQPAHVRFRGLPEGRREEKFAAMEAIRLDDDNWDDCPTAWRDPFLPEAEGLWASMLPLEEMFAYNGSGVMPGRTWIISPDATSLERRWHRLVTEANPSKKAILFHPHLRNGEPGDKHLGKPIAHGLPGHEERLVPVVDDHGGSIQAIHYGFRSFDRQWIIPDARLINQPNPKLWGMLSPRQVLLTAPSDRSPSGGPALTLSAAITDLHHYNGRGGRVYPLWHDRAAKTPNIKLALVTHLAEAFGREVTAEDVMAYIAATLAHPAFTSRFEADLVQPGLRVPLTADAALFDEAAALGREVVWLHCYGERFVDAAANRPRRPPRLPKAEAPYVPEDGAIPSAPEPLPDEIDYDPATRRLRIGKGSVENVSPAVWAYEVSGKQVIRQWFSYRRRDRSRPIIGDRRPPSPLDSVQPESWLAEYTSDLIDLLHVLGRLVALEPAQAVLLDRICAGPLLDADALALVLKTQQAGDLAGPVA